MKFLIGIGATVVDVILLLLVSWVSHLMAGELTDTAMTILLVLTVVVALVAYILCGGLSIAFKSVGIAFRIGMWVPIFPVDIVLGITLSAFALVGVWLFPIIPITLDHFFGDNNQSINISSHR